MSFTHHAIVFTVDFEKVNAAWVVVSLTVFGIQTAYHMCKAFVSLFGYREVVCRIDSIGTK